MKEKSIEESLIIGSNYQITADTEDNSKPLVVRGVIKRDHMAACRKKARDFYYIDTGYVGNFPSVGNPTGKKIWHRVVKNDIQHCNINVFPDDRWNNLIVQDPRLQFKGWKKYDKKILLVLPNPKACKYYGIDYETWVTDTTEKIKQFSNLPIEVRVKGSRSYRNHEYSIYDALDSGVHATVVFNSIAALESVLYGVPAFVGVPCAASPLASNDLTKIMTPFYPNADTIQQQCNNIAYGQFTIKEIENGTAWKILNGK